MFTNKNLPCIIDLDFKGLPYDVIFHQGRTDKNGGHTDLFNKSGLGLYHFHHRLSAHLHNKTTPICPYENTQTFIINPHNGEKVAIGQPYIVEDIKYYSINLVSKALVFLDYMGGLKSSSDAVDGKFYICSTLDSSIISSYEEFTFIYPKSLLMIKNNTFFKTQNDKLQLISNSKSTDTVNCYAYISLNEIKNHMLKNGYFTDFTDDGNDVWSFKRKNNVIIKSPKNGDLFKVGDVLKVEIYTNNVMYATLNIGNYKELKNSIKNENIVTFSDYIFTKDNLGDLNIEVRVGDSIYLDTDSSTVQVFVESSGKASITKDWLNLYINPTVSGSGRNVTKHQNANNYDWGMAEELNIGMSDNLLPVNARNATGKTPIKTTNNLYVDDTGRYWVAVGPNVMNPNFSGNKITDKDMQYGTKIDIVVLDETTNTIYYIPAVVGDAKEHSAPDGIYQTGVPFDTNRPTVNQGVDKNTVEFMGYGITASSVNISNNYKLIELIVYDGVYNYK